MPRYVIKRKIPEFSKTESIIKQTVPCILGKDGIICNSQISVNNNFNIQKSALLYYKQC